MGPARIPYHHRTILGYCKEFGVELEVFTNDNRAALFHNRDRFGGEPVPGRRVMTDQRGYIAELLAKAVKGSALDSALSGDDKERVLAMLRAYGGLNPDHLYKGSNRGGYRGEPINKGLKAGELDDSLDFRELLKSDFWRYKLHYSQFLNSNPTLMQPVGGMDAIVRAFEQRVGSLIRYGSVVTEIRKTPDGAARIVYRDTRTDAVEAVEADFAICTIPAPVLKDVPNDFSPETRAAIASMKFVPAVKVAFQARRRFWEEDHAIYGGISWTDQDITQIWYPANGYHRGKGVILGAYIWDDEPCMRYGNMSPPERLQAAMAEGERIHPGYSAELESGISRAWAKVPFQKGGWPESGGATEALARPDGAIYNRRRPDHRPARLAGRRRPGRPLGGERHRRAGREALAHLCHPAVIVATAGHVDHGKTALVRTLTGVDTDRLPEEKQRGLTIDLGFAYHPARRRSRARVSWTCPATNASCATCWRGSDPSISRWWWWPPTTG